MGPVESMGPAINIAGWLLVSFSGLFLALRIYCKFLKHRGLWWDDHVLLAAWVALLVDMVINSYSISLGFGEHIWDIDAHNLANIGLLGQLGATVSILAAVWSKTSFGMTLLRITEKKTKATVWFIIVTMNLAMSMSALITWIQCNPVAKGWETMLPGSCWDPKVNAYYGVFSGAYSGTMDIVLALLPWSVVWNLQMKKKEKIGVAIAMSMGVFAGCTAFVKSSKILLLLKGDFTFEGYHLVIWGSAETAITIMAASIPVLRVLVREVKTATRRRYGESTNSDTYHKKSYGAGTVQRANTVTMVTSDYKHGIQSSNAGSFPSFVREDDSSDKSIIGAHKASGKILQTQEITVRYHERTDVRDMGQMV
ncbi:hypothetical protein QBC46DRAFT_299422 [Diplogelasinospora grovesii]|uniref:Rhodopsin domain-containing protein n=1 Tax=Diplogelasinospora grovesii TaxID=303347 RepID=A0AAN6MXH8_9PEZI|nr:hypothetical protein QBC46DRAFT_299422 [Diplogelasinospora grovesii]